MVINHPRLKSLVANGFVYVFEHVHDYGGLEEHPIDLMLPLV
jgi:hypothetical protein